MMDDLDWHACSWMEGLDQDVQCIVVINLVPLLYNYTGEVTSYVPTELEDWSSLLVRLSLSHHTAHNN